MAGAMDLLPWTFSDVDSYNPALIDARIFRNETEENRLECMEELIEFFCETCHDVTPNLSPNFLMRFLRGSKFKTSLAYKRLKGYYDCLRKHSDIFKFFLPCTTWSAQSLNHITALPFRTKDNSIVVIHRLGRFDPSVCSFEELVRLDFLIFETLLTNPVTQLCGITVIFDFKGFSVEKFSEFTPSRIQSIFEVYDRSLTLRIVSGHIVNAPVMMNSLYRLVLNKLDDGLREQFIFHPTDEWEELHSHIPPEILPEEYCGTLPSSGLVNLYDLINSNEDYFFELMRYGISPESETL